MKNRTGLRSVNLHSLFLVLSLIGLSACSSVRVLAPTPNIFGNGAYPEDGISQTNQTAQPTIFFMTDRLAEQKDGERAYGSERSSAMTFGATTVAFGENLDWPALTAASGEFKRSEEIKLSVTSTLSLIHISEPTRPY